MVIQRPAGCEQFDVVPAYQAALPSFSPFSFVVLAFSPASLIPPRAELPALALPRLKTKEGQKREICTNAALQPFQPHTSQSIFGRITAAAPLLRALYVMLIGLQPRGSRGHVGLNGKVWRRLRGRSEDRLEGKRPNVTLCEWRISMES